jgi:predicted TIM-barrel fold metal-dependent hydrolase
MSETMTPAERLAALDIVDCDSHLTEGVDDLLPYMEERHSGIKNIIAETENPRHDIFSITHSMPTSLHSDRNAWNTDEHTPEAKLERMDEFGIDRAIISPGLNLALPTVSNTRAAIALANAYNSWVLDNFIDESQDRFKALMALPHQTPDLAAEEIDRRADEDGIAGVTLSATGLVPPPGHRQYEPIYEAAERHGFPIFMHSASINTSHVFPIQRMYNETYTEEHVTVHPFSHMQNLTSLIVQGIPERYPDLEFVFQEAGIGWIPYTMWRLDDHYLELEYEMPVLTKRPSEYVHDQFYFTTQPLGHPADPTHLAKTIEMAGPDNIMFASDLPHSDFDPPEELFNRIDSYFDEETVAGMMGETAKELLGWD